jgi:hypothetical protein
LLHLCQQRCALRTVSKSHKGMSCVAEAAATVVEVQPPLPQDDQPPLPNSLPEQGLLPASASAPIKQTEYWAEPVRAPTPPAAATELAEPPGELSIPIIPPEEESKKRKAKKNPAASAKRRATVKVGSLAPSVLNKWAAARKDLVSAPRGFYHAPHVLFLCTFSWASVTLLRGWGCHSALECTLMNLDARCGRNH